MQWVSLTAWPLGADLGLYFWAASVRVPLELKAGCWDWPPFTVSKDSATGVLACFCPLQRLTPAAWPLGAPVVLSFYTAGGTAAGCFIYSPFWASITPQPAGTDSRLVRLARLFVRRARRPS